DIRARDALAKILEKFIATELRRWVRTFPAEFYKEMFRLWEWPYDPKRVQKPSYVGKLTNDLVYERLAPGVKDELKRLTPRDSKGRHKHQLHRRLSEDVGHPKLLQHLGATIALMRVSKTKEEFMNYMDTFHPKYGSTLRFDFRDES